MTISQVSEKYGLSADTLRYYEKVGLIPPVHRRESGVRDYTPQDCQWVEFIKCMRGAGLCIDTLVEYVALFRQGNSTVAKRKQLLIQERNALKTRIEDLQNVLKRLNYKIDSYEKILVPHEKKLIQ